MSEIAVIGTASNDTLHLSSGVFHTVGGAGLYTALAAARAGADTTLFAPRPDPMPAVFDTVVKSLIWTGPLVTLEALPRLEIAHHGDGRATLLGAAWNAEAQLTPETLPPDMSQFDIVHIAALSSAARQLAFFEQCRANGAHRISVGTYARLAQHETATVRALLEQADLFFMNENESHLLFGGPQQFSSRAGAAVFITLGAQGAVVIADGQSRRVPGQPTVEIDPTGAGDTFCGTVLAGLAAGTDIIAAAKAGCARAARIIEHPGPFLPAKP